MNNNPTHERARERSMNDDELVKLKQARERVDTEPHHHHETLAREIEAWWGVTNGDEMVNSYGDEAVKFAHEKMQGFSPEQLDSIRNLGGYFRRLCAQNIPTSGAQPLERSVPHLKRKLEADKKVDEGYVESLERRNAAAEIPGTLEHRIKYGSTNDGDCKQQASRP